jgi:hypothetical protein
MSNTYLDTIPTECPKCGAEALKRTWAKEYIGYSSYGFNLSWEAPLPVLKCEGCEEIIHDPYTQEWHRKNADVLANMLGILERHEQSLNQATYRFP